jgi:hypothetical protein
MKILRKMKKVAAQNKRVFEYIKWTNKHLDMETCLISQTDNLPQFDKEFLEISKKVCFIPEYFNKHTELKINSKMEALVYQLGEGVVNLLNYFYYYGQKVILLKNKSLRTQLENTKIKNISFNDIEIPHKFFYISLEKEIGDFLLDGMFFQNKKEAIELYLLVSDKTVWQTEVELVNIPLNKNMDIHKSINESIEGLKEAGADKGFNEKHQSVELLTRYAVEMAMNIIILLNTIRTNDDIDCYIEENNKLFDTKIKKVNGKLAGKISDSNYYYTIKNNSNKNQEIEEENKNTRGQNKTLFYVSGHYRKQPVGPLDNRTIKIIWIEPYIKGRGFKSKDKLSITVI